MFAGSFPFSLSVKVQSSLRAGAALLLSFALLSSAPALRAQQPNPVEREVTNPLTDTPNVNPLQQNQPVARPQASRLGDEKPQGEELVITARDQSLEGEEGKRTFIYEGDADARFGIFRLQADRIIYDEQRQLVVADGNVVFDQEPGERITGSRAEFNVATRTGFFLDASGFTNQTQDGTVINFTASRVEKAGPQRIIAYNAEITACDEETPKWSFRTRRAVVDLRDRVSVTRPSFRVKGTPLVVLPYASVSIKPRDRASGFLTPTFSGSGNKGFRVSNAYYQTLGRSADITLRNDIYTSRGLGFGADVRTIANSRSFLNFGFFTVKDRIFGAKASPENPDQGGSSLYARGVQYFPNGFLAVADVNITSNLAFRQVFSDTIQQAISPEERSQVFINRNFRDYSFDFLARTQVTSIESARIRTRQLPSITFDKRPSLVERFSQRLPLYFSFESRLEGVSRKETPELTPLPGTDLLPQPLSDPLSAPLVSPSIVQRLDAYPRFSVPFNLGGRLRGWTLTATAAARATYYSDSLAPGTRTIAERTITRGYGELEFDVRPPAFARNFYGSTGDFRFRHTIEPYLTYRKIGGVDEKFNRLIRFDQADTVADTNEFEFGVTNRFWTRRAANRVGGAPAATNNARANGTPPNSTAKNNTTDDAKDDEATADGVAADEATTADAAANTNAAADANAAADDEQARGDTAYQPYEALTVTLRGKYFFDPTFGGALVPGRRNQFFPINTFSGFTFGGVPRRFSPVNLQARLRPAPNYFADARLDFDLRDRGGLRDLALTFGLDRSFVRAYQTFYFTRAVNLAPSLARFADAAGNEPGTRQGSQWTPAVLLGRRDRGFFGGVAFFFDFQNRPDRGGSSLISSTTTFGYNFDCCAVTIQNYSFDVGLRQENRFVFSFRLNGIGTFGTEPIGQGFR